jgi:hypothetical protein
VQNNDDPQVDFARTLVPYYYLLLPRFYLRDQTGTGSFSGSMKDHVEVRNLLLYKTMNNFKGLSVRYGRHIYNICAIIVYLQRGLGLSQGAPPKVPLFCSTGP